jgi:hypothetical protein
MPCLVERLSPSDAVDDDAHKPVDSAASASPGLRGSQRSGRPVSRAAEGPKVASTLALVIPVIGRESSPTTCVRRLSAGGCGDLAQPCDLRSSSVVFHHRPSMSRMVC